MQFIRITQDQAMQLRMRATGERRQLLKQWLLGVMYSGTVSDTILLPAGLADDELIKELEKK